MSGLERLPQDPQDDLLKEVCRLRKDNQVLRAHCSKYQEDIIKLQATVNALEQEKKINFSFVINNLLQQSELSLKVMPYIMSRESDIATPDRRTTPQPTPRRILSSGNSPPAEESSPSPKTMRNGRPRRKAAPKDLRERSLATKLRR